MSQFNQSDNVTAYIEKELVAKGIISEYNNNSSPAPSTNNFIVSSNTPSNGQALLYNSTSGEYEPGNVGAGSALSNVGIGAEVLKGIDNLRTIYSPPSSNIQITQNTDEIEIKNKGLDLTVDPKGRLIGYYGNTNNDDTQLIDISDDFDLGITGILNLNQIGTSKIQNLSVTNAKLSNNCIDSTKVNLGVLPPNRLFAGSTRRICASKTTSTYEDLGYLDPITEYQNNLSVREGIIYTEIPNGLINTDVTVTRGTKYIFIRTASNDFRLNLNISNIISTGSTNSPNEGFSFKIYFYNVSGSIGNYSLSLSSPTPAKFANSSNAWNPSTVSCSNLQTIQIDMTYLPANGATGSIFVARVNSSNLSQV